MVKITEQTYKEFPSLRGREQIFAKATEIVVDGWAEAKRQMSQPQKTQQIKQGEVQQQQGNTTSLPTT